MKTLGVDINLSKSLVSTEGSLEFAKKLIIQGKDLSPIGPRSIIQLIRNPASLKEMIINNKVINIQDLDFLDNAAVLAHLRNLLDTPISTFSDS